MAILVELQDSIGLLTLDRPERAHAYDRAHLDAIASGLEQLLPAARAIVISATGTRAFCAGADLRELAAADPLSALDLHSQRVFTRLARSPVPTIAAIQGAAVAGGCELALACDFRVVGPRARFRLPETALGLLPAAGGSTRLARLIGTARAKEVILAGTDVDAQTALAWGLATRLDDDPLQAALALAQTLAARDPVALRLAKQILDADEDPRSLAAERLSEALLYHRRPPPQDS